jgi:hypothetical protein
MAITQTEINGVVEHYRKERDVDIRHLRYDEQRILVELFLHGTEKVVERLLEKAKGIEMDIVHRVWEVGHSDD